MNNQRRSDDAKVILHAFSRALRREAHVLAQRPDLLWQQLYNRLQWEEENTRHVMACELSLRLAPGTKPWLRLKTPYRESAALLRTLSGHINQVLALSFSPDGSKIVSISKDNSLKVWEVASGRELHTLKGPNLVFPGAFASISPKGDRIATVSYANDIKLWSTDSGQELFTLNGNTTDVLALSFSPDGTRIASVSNDYSLKVWDLTNGQEIRTLCWANEKDRRLELIDEVSGQVLNTISWTNKNAVAYSPDAAWIASASAQGNIKLWDAASGQERHTLRGNNGCVNAIAFSPDGDRLISANDDKTLTLWDIAREHEPLTLKGHTKEAVAAAFSPDGTSIISASRDGTLKLWDTDSGQESFTLSGHTGSVTAVAFNPEGTKIVSADDENSIKLWSISETPNLSTGSLGRRLPKINHSESVTAIAFCPDGNKFVSASEDMTLKLWDTGSTQEIHTMRGHTGAVTDAAFSSDGVKIISAGSDNSLKIWDASSGQELRTFTDGVGQGNALERQDGSKVVTFSLGSMPIKMDSVSAEDVQVIDWDGLYNAVAISPDSTFLISACHNSLKLWNTASGNEIRLLQGHRNLVTASIFSPDGSKILSASWDMTLKLWDAASGQEVFTLRGHTGRVEAVAFSPDGTRIVSAGVDKTLKLWDTASGQELHTIIGHTDIVSAVAFSPDGTLIVTASRDQTLKIWDARDLSHLVTISMPGVLNCVGLHPWLPLVVCGDRNGSFYLFELVGINYGSIITTAVIENLQIFDCCPACQQRFPIRENQLNSELTCPTPGCGLRLKINPFVIKMA